MGIVVMLRTPNALTQGGVGKSPSMWVAAKHDSQRIPIAVRGPSVKVMQSDALQLGQCWRKTISALPVMAIAVNCFHASLSCDETPICVESSHGFRASAPIAIFTAVSAESTGGISKTFAY
jgi:hypothetical protein